MDWNWFFSALAQSCAAIVGLMGAFIFSKIISNQNSMKQRLSDYDKLRIELSQLLMQINRRRFKWYNEKKLTADLLDIQRKIIKDETPRSAQEYIDECEFSPFIPNSDILTKVEDEIAKVCEYRHNPKQLQKERSRNGIQMDRHIMMRPELDSERKLIDDLVIDIRIHATLISEYVSETDENPESSPLISVTIIACLLLLYLGVIYPLGLLPADSFDPKELSISSVPSAIFSFRGILLLLVSTVFTSIMVCFGVINLRLKHDVNKIDRIRRYGKPKGYSEFLYIMEANAKE